MVEKRSEERSREESRDEILEREGKEVKEEENGED